MPVTGIWTSGLRAFCCPATGRPEFAKLCISFVKRLIRCLAPRDSQRQHFGQQGFRVRTRALAPGQAMGLAWGPGDQAFQDNFYYVGRGFGLEWLLGVVLKHIGHQRERQRIAVGEGQHLGVLPGGQAALAQVSAALLRAKISQRDSAHQRLPSGVGAPLLGWRIAARQHDQHLVGELGEETPPQPTVQVFQHSQPSTSRTNRRRPGPDGLRGLRREAARLTIQGLRKAAGRQ
jgi:hypothetical protein